MRIQLAQSRRTRAVITGATALVLGTGGVATPSTPIYQTTLDVNGALTKERIVGFGTLTPGAPRSDIRLRLLVQDGDTFREIARKRVGQRGDRRRTRFNGSFRARADATCRIVARFGGTRKKTKSRDVVTLPCSRPIFPTGEARLRDVSSGDEVAIDVEIADDDERRQFGLMYKRRLALDRGMVFQFESPRSGGFWMKNTLIPLSIAFFDASGVIVRILDMEPCTEEQDESSGCPTYDPEASYMGALEVNQGAFDDWNIDEGDVIFVTRD